MPAILQLLLIVLPSTGMFSSYYIFACRLPKFYFFSSSFSPTTLHLYPRYELFTAGCSSGVPCSLKLLPLVLKLSYFSPSCMLFVFDTLSLLYSVISSAHRYLPLHFSSVVVFFLFNLALLIFFPGLCYQLVVSRFSLFKTSLEPSFTLNIIKDNGSLGSPSATVI